ncbi:MAG: hypothetical protein GY859_21230, partial [Desulfobacterales bacterium]|nr:hypothetical protein [Desulfobacterales bacterium]
TGSELLASLMHFKEHSEAPPDLLPERKALGPPLTIFQGPCRRCWLYSRDDTSGRKYCPTCQAIVTRARSLVRESLNALVVWGNVNQTPRQLRRGAGFYKEHVLGYYIRDEHHFLLVLPRLKMKTWIQELLIYHGKDLGGLLQIFPTTGSGGQSAMDDTLSRAIHLDRRYPYDKLRVRFYPSPYHVFTPHLRDCQGRLTFEVREFLNHLEMAAIFRSLLRPEEQRALKELLRMENLAEKRFNWGRLTGDLSPAPRDMLEAWGIRNWPESRIELLYELLDYAEFTT